MCGSPLLLCRLILIKLKLKSANLCNIWKTFHLMDFYPELGIKWNMPVIDLYWWSLGVAVSKGLTSAYTLFFMISTFAHWILDIWKCKNLNQTCTSQINEEENQVFEYLKGWSKIQFSCCFSLLLFFTSVKNMLKLNCSVPFPIPDHPKLLNILSKSINIFLLKQFFVRNMAY